MCASECLLVKIPLCHTFLPWPVPLYYVTNQADLACMMVTVGLNWIVDSNKKLKDALIEFSGDVGLCKQQEEVSNILFSLQTERFFLFVCLCNN